MVERVSEVVGRDVLEGASAEDQGRVRKVLLGRRPGNVLAVEVGRRLRGHETVPWSSLRLGPDAVVLDGPHELSPGVADEVVDPIGARILDTAGFEHGTVRDVVFDPSDGRVERVIGGDREWPAGALRALGRYALVVAAPREEERR